MKKLFIIILLIFACANAKSQSPAPGTGFVTVNPTNWQYSASKKQTVFYKGSSAMWTWPVDQPILKTKLDSLKHTNDSLFSLKQNILINPLVQGDSAKYVTPFYFSGHIPDISGKVDKTQTVNGHPLTGNINVTRSDLSVDNVDNTSDLNKPVSTAQQAGLNSKADLVAGKVPLSQINDALLGSVNYQSSYSVINNSPALPAASGHKGWYYIIADSGFVSLTYYKKFDWIVSNGTSWDKIDNNSSVSRVNGYAGNVVLNTDDISEGSVNKWLTLSGVRAAMGITCSGTSGTATYNPLTGVYNIPHYQDALTSGTTIKTVNGTSLLGSGNITLQTALTAGTDYWNGGTGNHPTNISGYGITDALSTNATLGTSISLGTVWNATSNQNVPTNLIGGYSNGYVYNFTLDQIKSWLGLGSNAYTSTAYLPLSGGDITGQTRLNAGVDIYFGSPTTANYGIGVYFNDAANKLYFYNGYGGTNIFSLDRGDKSATFSGALNSPSASFGTTGTKIEIYDGGEIGISSPATNDNMVLRSKGTGSLMLNYTGGTGGTKFYNGGTTQVAWIDCSGAAGFNSTVSAPQFNAGSAVIGAATGFGSDYARFGHKDQDNTTTYGFVQYKDGRNFIGGTVELSHQLKSDVSIGTAPFVVASTTTVSNLNAELWHGQPYENSDADANLTVLMGENSVTGRWTYYHSTAVKSFLGLNSIATQSLATLAVNALPKITSTNTLVNSLISDDGSNVSVNGNLTSYASITAYGDINASGGASIQGPILNDNLSGVGVRMVTADTNGYLDTQSVPAPTSGTYTPTITDSYGVTSLVITGAVYTRIGNIVHVRIGGRYMSSSTGSAGITFRAPFNYPSSDDTKVGQGVINEDAGINYISGPVELSDDNTSVSFSFNKSVATTLSEFIIQFDYTTNQ